MNKSEIEKELMALRDRVTMLESRIQEPTPTEAAEPEVKPDDGPWRVFVFMACLFILLALTVGFHELGQRF